MSLAGQCGILEKHVTCWSVWNSRKKIVTCWSVWNSRENLSLAGQCGIPEKHVTCWSVWNLAKRHFMSLALTGACGSDPEGRDW